MDLSVYKKRKKKKKVQEREYAYMELLDRLYVLLYKLGSKNPALQVRRRTIPPLQLTRAGTKKTAWTNFRLICQALQRSTLHVNHFFSAELKTESSTDPEGALVLKGRYIRKHMESLLKKYIKNYVSCHICQSPETTLTKDPETRLQFLCCETCNARRSVEPITSGKFAPFAS